MHLGQQAAVARIDAMLQSSDGMKLEVVAELGKVRGEVEAGKVVAIPPQTFPTQWSYHLEPTMRLSGSIEFATKGTFTLKIVGRQPEEGKWKKSHD